MALVASVKFFFDVSSSESSLSTSFLLLRPEGARLALAFELGFTAFSSGTSFTSSYLSSSNTTTFGDTFNAGGTVTYKHTATIKKDTHPLFPLLATKAALASEIRPKTRRRISSPYNPADILTKTLNPTSHTKPDRVKHSRSRPTRRSSRRIGNSRKIGLRARLRTGKGMHDIQNHAAVTIQAHYRGWKARKLQESKRGRPGSVGLRAEMPPVVGDHRPREDTVMQNVLAALRKAATRVSDRMQSTGDDMGRDDAAWLADVNEKWAQFAELYASKACSARQHLTLAAETNGCLEVLKNALSQSPSAMESI
ncbi:hypothetical protein SeMB42_g01561 [Synchytrium endobioticum]|uniref:Uncharacterized protein n=1 Tax=Synchytrium endobioticum TaxID=286115 RepID=A0A507DL25_9FUNG|nr:hypothetical protein SeMB42_g01561 [Synchytrium endobioticum]